MTRLVMTLLVRDEAELVRANVDYHLAHGVDFVVATDNRSVDGTREILEEYARAGVLRLLDERGDDFMQDAWVTRMAHLAHDAYGADWILPNDADELWCPHGGDLRALCAASAQDLLYVERVDLLPTLEQARAPGYAFHRNTLRPTGKAASTHPPPKRKVLMRAARLVSVDAGNHDARMVPGATRGAGAATIFHFPYRTYEAFERKVANGGAALLRNAHWPASWGRHWRQWYAALERGALRDVYEKLVPSERVARDMLADGRFEREPRIEDWFGALR